MFRLFATLGAGGFEFLNFLPLSARVRLFYFRWTSRPLRQFGAQGPGGYEAKRPTPRHAPIFTPVVRLFALVVWGPALRHEPFLPGDHQGPPRTTRPLDEALRDGGFEFLALLGCWTP